MMISIEQLAESEISAYISYGWTSDYRETLTRILSLSAHEPSKLVCIQGTSLYAVRNNGNITNVNIRYFFLTNKYKYDTLLLVHVGETPLI